MIEGGAFDRCDLLDHNGTPSKGLIAVAGEVDTKEEDKDQHNRLVDSLLTIHSNAMDSFSSTQEVLDKTTLVKLGREAGRKGAKLTYLHHTSGLFVSVKWEDMGFYNRQMCLLKNCYQARGRVVSVKQGTPLSLGHITLHPILFEFAAKLSSWNPGLTQNCRSDVKRIPYFFRDTTTCERVLQWLKSHAPDSDQALCGFSDEEFWRHADTVQEREREMLVDLSKIVCRGGLLIYWDHLCHEWAYMKKKDSNRYRREMCMLKKYLRVSRQTCAPNSCHIEQGKELQLDDLGDVILYPLLFQFHDKKCHAQTVLQLSKTCENHLGLTPYLFQNEQLRDDVFDFLLSSKGSGCSVIAGCRSSMTSVLSRPHSLLKTGEGGGHQVQHLRCSQESCKGLEEGDDNEIISLLGLHPCSESGLDEEDDTTTISFPAHCSMTLLCAQKDAELAELREVKDSEIAALCAEKDAEIAALRMERDTEIAKKDAEIAEKDAEIAKLCVETDALCARTEAETAMLREKRLRVARMEREVAALQKELS